MNESVKAPRRLFLKGLSGVAGLAALGSSSAKAETGNQSAAPASHASGAVLPAYACMQNYRALKQSSFDRTGGDFDFWKVGSGETKEIFSSEGPGVITHIWFTLAPSGWFPHPLKQTALRIYWDGNTKPSVEVPLGDFFCLTLDEYVPYQSIFTNCASVKALNAYFSMPFREHARITVTNEADTPIDALYSNIDYQLVPELPTDAMYFHAQYRQKTPNVGVQLPNPNHNLSGAPNLLGKDNYVFLEARGQGHLLGVALGVLQNQDGWWGEGDDMTFIDDEGRPVINGTGSEDYFNGAWDFGGFDAIVPFAYLYNGAPMILNPERTGGRYCLYRWHVDNPITFRSYIKHTIEHGAANDRSDNYYSVAYWYQTEPYTDFPPLPSASERLVKVHCEAQDNRAND